MARPVQPLAPRAVPVVVLFWVLIGFALFTVATDVFGYVAVTRALDGASGAESLLSTSDTLDRFSALWLPLVIGLAVLFLLWFHRAASNLEGLGHRARRSPGWSVGSWFVPFVNLVVPKQVANDLWRSGETDPELAQRPFLDRPVAPLVHWWWAAWIVSNVVDNFVARRWVGEADDLETFKGLYVVDGIAALLNVVAALLAIRVVRGITERQDARAALGPAPGPERAAPTPYSVEPAWAPSPEHRDG